MTSSHTISKPMDAETLDALRGSIAKWEGIVAGTMKDFGSVNCALCHKFADNDDCDGCPVARATGEGGCRGSPYFDFDAGDKAGEQQMLDFLRSLLPPLSDEERR